MKNPVVEEWLTRPSGVAERLRALRSRSGLSHRQLATALSWPPSKLSKLETGKQMPTVDDLEAFAAAVGAKADEAADLVGQLDGIERLRLDWAGRSAKAQADHDALARGASTIRTFQPSLAPGLLQVEGYAEAVLRKAFAARGWDAGGVEKALRARLERGRVVFDQSKRFEFIVTEAVLRTRVAPVEAMQAQMFAFQTVANMANVRLGVVPFSAEVGFADFVSFVIYDDTLVTEAAAESVASVAPAARYVQHSDLMDAMWLDAVEGDEARALIVRAADALR